MEPDAIVFIRSAIAAWVCGPSSSNLCKGGAGILWVSFLWSCYRPHGASSYPGICPSDIRIAASISCSASLPRYSFHSHDW